MALQEEEEDESQQQQQQPKRTKTSETSENLQSIRILLPEIVIEILSRLPVESLLRCKSVCKSWRSLISDPHLIKYHLSLSNSNSVYAHHRLIMCAGRTTVLWCPLHDLIYDKSFNSLRLDYPSKHPEKIVWIAGSCHGLLCIIVKDESLEETVYIWNPSTRQSNKLPSPRLKALDRTIYGFGYDESSDDYKVVSIELNGARYNNMVMIYSLKYGNWKRSGNFPRCYLIDFKGKFSNGALHWASRKDLGSSSSWTIISLDLATETYDEVPQPVYDEGDVHLQLGAVGEWLCVVCNYSETRKIDVCVMKVYGVKDSWTKLVSIQNLTDPPTNRFWECLSIANDGLDSIQYVIDLPTDLFWECLSIANDGTILFRYGQTLFLYDVKNGSFSRIKKYDSSLEAWITVESLVSPYALRDS